MVAPMPHPIRPARNPDEQQVSIDLLRAYLRTPMRSDSAGQDQNDDQTTEKPKPDRGEAEVCKTIVRTLQKRRLVDADDPNSWSVRDCSMREADLCTRELRGADLTGANFVRAKTIECVRAACSCRVHQSTVVDTPLGTCIPR